MVMQCRRNTAIARLKDSQCRTRGLAGVGVKQDRKHITTISDVEKQGMFSTVGLSLETVRAAEIDLHSSVSARPCATAGAISLLYILV